MTDTPNPSTLNHFNEASVRLPPALADRSMQMYMLANGDKNFNIVVSRSEAKPEETLEAFAERVLDESKRTLAGFQLEDRRERLVAKIRGIELTFSWKANAMVLHQRQAIFLAPGAEPDKPTGLLVTATCQGMLVHPYTDLFEETVASLQWRHPIPNADAANEARTGEPERSDSDA